MAKNNIPPYSKPGRREPTPEDFVEMIQSEKKYFCHMENMGKTLSQIHDCHLLGKDKKCGTTEIPKHLQQECSALRNHYDGTEYTK